MAEGEVEMRYAAAIGRLGKQVGRYLGSVGLLAAVAVGCSQQDARRAAVAGTVRVDGEPLPDGSIAFFPTDKAGGPSAGGVISQGKYDIPRSQGAVVGKNRVEIRGFRNSGKQVRDVWGSGTVDQRISALGEQYNNRSTLASTVEPGENHIDFDLPGIPEH